MNRPVPSAQLGGAGRARAGGTTASPPALLARSSLCAPLIFTLITLSAVLQVFQLLYKNDVASYNQVPQADREEVSVSLHQRHRSHRPRRCGGRYLRCPFTTAGDLQLAQNLQAR